MNEIEQWWADSTPESRGETLKNVVTDLMSGLLYYDRKEDESLPRGGIEKMLESGEITHEGLKTLLTLALEDALPEVTLPATAVELRRDTDQGESAPDGKPYVVQDGTTYNLQGRTVVEFTEEMNRLFTKDDGEF